MLTVCVIMSLSIYLHHKRTHRTAMLWGTQPIGSCLRSEDWKELIHDLQSPKTETTLWYCEELHSKTLERTENTTFAWGLILPSLPSFLPFFLNFRCFLWAGTQLLSIWSKALVANQLNRFCSDQTYRDADDELIRLSQIWSRLSRNGRHQLPASSDLLCSQSKRVLIKATGGKKARRR